MSSTNYVTSKFSEVLIASMKTELTRVQGRDTMPMALVMVMYKHL
jgi:hypothetical protein